MSPVVGVTPRGQFPGVSRVFEEGAGVCPDFTHLFTGQDIPKECVLIVGAWAPEYGLLLRRHQGPKYVLWTSPLLQTEMGGPEMEYLQTVLLLKRKGVVNGILWNDAGAAEAFGGLHFPHPYVLPEPSKVPEDQREGAGLYAPAHPRKNILTQAIAAKLAGLRLHLNGADHYHGVLRDLDVDFEDHGWLPAREAYLDDLGRRKVSLGVFLSESHCYSIHDSLALGVPAVVSGCVARNMGLSVEESVSAIDDPVEIGRSLEAILVDYERESRRARSCAERVAEDENEAFRRVIRILGG